LNEVIKNYLSSTTVNAPFFLVVGDENYASTKTRLLELRLKQVAVSDCCSAADKPPSLDRLIATLDFADIADSSRDKKIVVVGLGEYLALCGESKAYKFLSDLKDKKVGNARVVLLLRGVSSLVRKLQATDPTRLASNRIFFSDNIDSDINVTIFPSILNLSAKSGIKELLRDLESGKTTVSVKTNAAFDNSLFLVHRFESAYDGVKHLLHSRFPLAESIGTPEQWTEFLTALTAKNGEISALIDEFGNNPENSFLNCINGISYKNWLYFITLKLKAASIGNSYLKYVVETTDNFADFKRNVMDAILVIPHTDGRFNKFYEERKALVEKFSESDIASFVAENQRDIAESVYKLTDQTLTERKEFVALFENTDKNTVLTRASIAYQALPDYLRKYTFADPKVSTQLNALFTDYFDSYKWQKVLNAIDDDFILQVEELANKRVYNGLRTRTEIIGTVDKIDTFLYWVDALGVEFLGFIQKLCERKGLSLHIHIAQTELPTITSVNKGFFADWEGEREKEERLDELKHKENGGYSYKRGSRPVHLAQELDIISEVIEKAATKLALYQCKRVLIVSDHGASRLAVIKEQEEKYEVDADSKGKHGGRCCKRPSDYSPMAYDLPFATESADGEYLVLANYGRFKGSRAANIEVHGGASLEEVVIPIIEITLANPDTKIELLNGDNLYANFRKKLEFTLFSKTELAAVSVNIKGKPAPYNAVKTDKNHYLVATDITRPGKYTADVLDGDNLVGKITLTAQSETQKKSASNGDFDDIL
jgi:hypothetical protein